MKVFVTICTTVYEEEYEGWSDRNVEGVYSSREKARDAIKNSADEMLRSLETRCGGNCEECSEEEREYCHVSISSDGPDKIRVHDFIDYYYVYSIVEIELDH